MNNVKWGVIAPGNISTKFANDMALIDGNEIHAVASRNLGRAKDFADKYDIKKAYGSYAEIIADPDVEIIYIATPHTWHADLAIKCINAGKAVLCEKPLGINSKEVNAIIEASQSQQVFMMEAMWSRFNPAINAALGHIKNGDIGEPNYVQSDFTFYRDAPVESRLLNMDLAGGSLLDIGIYPLFMAYLILGKPSEIKAVGRKHDTGADTQIAASLLYDNAIAQVSSSILSKSDMVAKIAGKKGAIYIDTQWHMASGYTVQNESGTTHYDLPATGMGYSHEILECAKCLKANKIQSDLWSHQCSIDLVGMMDDIRAQIDLKYPFE